MASRPVAPRRYHSPLRVAQAQQTRKAVVSAARRLFARNGYEQVTIASIAEEAGVALPTIYSTFGSKAAILSAILATAGTSPGVQLRVAAAAAERDPRRQLRLVVAFMRAAREEDADIVKLVWLAGVGDAELVAAWRENHADRWGHLTELAELLDAKGALKPALTVKAATETLWGLSSPELYRLFVEEHGWTPKRWEEWLAETASTLLLRKPGTRAARGTSARTSRRRKSNSTRDTRRHQKE